MIASDVTLVQLLENGDLGVTPIDRSMQIQPASIDLRLGAKYRPLRTGEEIHSTGSITFFPNETYLAHTVETVTIPRSMAATLWGRSSMGRMGLEIHIAGFIDPGFRGQIVLEITNESTHKITLDVGTRVCQMALYHLDQPAGISYAEKNDAKYVDQTGATPSMHDA